MKLFFHFEPQLQALPSPQPHWQAVGAGVDWQPQVQLAPGQLAQAQDFRDSVFMAGLLGQWSQAGIGLCDAFCGSARRRA